MKRFLLFIAVILVFTGFRAAAQGISISNLGIAPDSSAMLDVSSINKGMLMPRMTQVQRLAIVNPAEGLMVFQTDNGCVYYFRNSAWWKLCGSVDCVGYNFSILAGNGGNNPVSAGGTVTLTTAPTGGTNPVSYSWSGPLGFTSTAQNPTRPSALPAMSGVYSVTATEGNGCSASSTVSVSVCGMSVVAGSNSPVSVGNSINLTSTPSNGTAPYSYSWAGPLGYTSTLQNPSISNAQTSQSGTYTVLVTDAASCTATGTVTVSVNTCMSNDSVVFSYTGGQQTWTAPSGLCGAVTFKVWGAQGSNTGGNGGYAQAQKTVTAGQVYYIYVGGMTGYNGGGTGGTGKNGGGGSDIRFGGTTFNERIIVAGGGGSAGACGPGGAGGGGTSCSNGAGGGGGNCACGTNGGPGTAGTCTSGGSAGNSGGGYTGGGGGGGLSSGGAGSTGGGYGATGGTGTLGTGGNRGYNSGYPTCNSGAGGGGGYYGGGGTSDGQCCSGGAGGGSSWASGTLSNMSFTGGVQTGDGRIVIKW